MTTNRLLTRLAWLLAALPALLPLAAASAPYRTQGGKILDPAGQELQIRGVSHFGFNAEILQPQYLWDMGWKEQIAQIKSLGFNAVRLPFVPDTLYATTPVDQLSWVDRTRNPELLGKTPLQVLDLWMAEADRQGLYVMLDFHSVSKIRQYPTWFVDSPADFGLVYNKQAYTADHWVRDLVFVARRYAALPHFIGIDLYNEPNGKVRWSTGDPNMTDARYFWKAAVEKAAAAILQANPDLLIFVQGINGNYDGVENSSLPMNWGEDLQPLAYQPLDVPAGKLVLVPHTYGPDVYVKSSFTAASFPANLAANWEALFGRFSAQYPVVTGEWGGKYGSGTGGAKDITWQNAFVDWMQSKGITSSFYWCYTPNSGDTGGILDDNLAVREDKMTLLRRHWGPLPAGTPVTSTPTTPAPTPAPAPSAGALSFSSPAYSVAQGAGSATLTVNRVGGTAGAVSVRYTTAAGTATRVDYGVRRGTLSWAARDGAAKSIVIPLSTATPFSGTRSFSVLLSSVSGGATLVTPVSTTVTITGSLTPAPAPAPVTSTPTPTPTPTTPTPTVYAQPYIQSFAPATGPVGTVVTVTGSGFTGLTHAWVGAAHDGTVSVVSDTQVRVTIPADATTGAIGLFNPDKVSFSATSFTVGASAPIVAPAPTSTTPSTTPTTTPTTGSGLAVRVQGGKLVNAAGAALQLRGVNYSGFEFAAIQGWSGNDPSGGQAGQPGGPKWSALQAWKVNTLRIPLNEASWLGYSCTDTGGAVHNPDPAGNYKQSVATQVQQANAAGIYVILDLHWTAPGTSCPMLQTQMADADHSLAFWNSVATMFKSNPAVMFELFNEPFLNFEFSGNAWSYMMKGTNGSFSGYPATGSSGKWVDVQKSWAIASYQQMIDAVRATGATNVVLVGTMQYAQDLSGWLANRPTDPLNQMAAAWHPYRLFDSAWDYPYPNYHPQVMSDAQALVAAGIPVVMTEVGAQNTAGTPSAPIITTMTRFADANGMGVIGWAWGVWGHPENVLIKDVNGTPTDGYGQTLRAWMLAH